MVHRAERLSVRRVRAGGVRRAVSPHDPRYLKAAALHDRALDTGWRWTFAAGLFEDALHADGVGKWERLRMTAVICWHWT